MPVQTVAVQAGFAGLVLGLSLIFSLGPQNLRLIRAGVMNSHALTVATVGYLSEIAVVLIGTAWMNRTLTAIPAVAGLLQGLGVGFLVWCGLRAFQRRTRHGEEMLAADAVETRSAAVLAMLAVTWLNPLVYLEVMFLVGVLASGYGDAGAWFSAGYLVAAAIRIYGWSLVGRTASPWLAAPRRRMQFEAVSGGFLILAATLLTLQLAQATLK